MFREAALIKCCTCGSSTMHLSIIDSKSLPTVVAGRNGMQWVDDDLPLSSSLWDEEGVRGVLIDIGVKLVGEGLPAIIAVNDGSSWSASFAAMS